MSHFMLQNYLGYHENGDKYIYAHNDIPKAVTDR